MRYFIDTDQSSHRYLVEAAHLEEWTAWASLPEDDERAWEVPSFAKRIDGAFLTFSDPHEGPI